MSKLKVSGNASGTGVITLEAPNTNTDRTITLPDSSDTLVSTAPGTSGNILTSDGTNWTSAAPAAGGADTSLSNLSATGEQRVCQAWVNFDGTGTVAIRDSHNVSSITDLGLGRYQVNFSSAMANANYSVVVGGGDTAPGTGEGMQTMAYNILTTSASISSWTYNGSGYLDMTYGFMQVFGD